MSNDTWTIGPADVGERLDKFLAAGGRLGSRARATAALDRGKVFLNDAEASIGEASARLALGDVVRFWIDRPGSATPRPRTTELDIVFEDEALIVIDKPAGLLTVPLPRKDGEPSVRDALDRYWSVVRTRPFVVHRIDRDTSGLVVFAKNAGAQQRLRDQFERRQPERVYRAVVYGHPEPAEGTWVDRLLWDERALLQRKVQDADRRGKEAVSAYRTLESFASTSLIEVRLGTGKRNQIRVQAAARGHQLVGEIRYVSMVPPQRTIAFPRQALHAYRLGFKHPTTGVALAFEAPMPADLEGLIARLRREARGRSRPGPS
ncbi:MAG: RluA family pseudouridine synthase [Vicinamibacterales bacterium]